MLMRGAGEDPCLVQEKFATRWHSLVFESIGRVEETEATSSIGKLQARHIASFLGEVQVASPRLQQDWPLGTHHDHDA